MQFLIDSRDYIQDEVHQIVSESKHNKTSQQETTEKEQHDSDMPSHGGKLLMTKSLMEDGKLVVAVKSLEIHKNPHGFEETNGKRPQEAYQMATRTEASDFELMFKLSDEQFVKIADHIRLQKTCHRIGLDSVESQHGGGQYQSR